MKQLIFKILSSFSIFIPVKVLIKLSGKNVIFPFYHIVSDNPPAHIKHLYPVRSIKQFEKDLDFLQKYFSATTFPPETNKKGFVLSFDDGLSEVYDIVAPILRKRNIPAIFFLNSAFIDNKDLFFKCKISLVIDKIAKDGLSPEISHLLNCKKRNCIKKILSLKFKDENIINKAAEISGINFKKYLETEKPYLSSSQAEELISQGFKAGAHSINHPLFSEISEKEQTRQTEESINFIRDRFNVKDKLFAFPFTDNGVKNTFFEKIFERNTTDFTFGTAGIKDDYTAGNIQRIPVEKYGLSAKRHIKTEYLLYLIKKLAGKEIVKRQ